MKAGLHPELKKIMITCACGEVYEVMSTQDNMRVEICSKCHPFYTGKQRFVTKGGRVERFQRKYGTKDESK